MSELINKKSLEYLAELARVELMPEEEEKMVKDLQEILNYFEELKSLDTGTIAPMTGGTVLKNQTREDAVDLKENKKGVNAFPDKQVHYLRVPPVF